MSVITTFTVKLARRPSPLGKGRPLKMDTVARAYSLDINMSPHCNGFTEDAKHQKALIVDFLVKNLKFISQADIYAESKSYSRNDNTYMPTGDAKLHWHGLIRFHKEFDNKSSVENFIKQMRKRFSSPSCTCTFRAVFFKKIRNTQHLKDRVSYQTKEVPLLIPPIKYTNEIQTFS